MPSLTQRKGNIHRHLWRGSARESVHPRPPDSPSPRKVLVAQNGRSRATLSAEWTWQANSPCTQDAWPLTLMAQVTHLVSVSAQRAGPAPARATGSPFSRSAWTNWGGGLQACVFYWVGGKSPQSPSWPWPKSSGDTSFPLSIPLLSAYPGEQGGRRWVKGCMCKISPQNLPKSTFYRE